MTKTDFSLAYCTNIWSHHVAPVCTELVRLLGEQCFKMCLFETVPEEQRKLGYASTALDGKWVVGPPSSCTDLARLRKIVCEADVAVLGACPQEIKGARVATGKLTFIMSERMMRGGNFRLRMFNPRFARGIGRLRDIVNRENVHYLAMGAYATKDVRQMGVFGERLWNWAYFTEVADHAPQPRTNAQMHILWAGRMLKWKRLDLLLRAVALVCHHPNFDRLDIVGSGQEQSSMLRLARKLGLADKCVFHAPVPAARVREFMRLADIYVLPSNRYEGWGAVANEAMSEGAVLVANEEAGAAKVLIEHGRTGFLFKDGDIDALAGILQALLADSDLQEEVRQAAWRDMQQVWHPRVGAKRLVGLCQGLLGLAPMPAYQDGLCCREAGIVLPNCRAL